MMATQSVPRYESNGCPECGEAIAIDESSFVGDIHCPGCDEPLWYISIPDARRFFSTKQSGALREEACDFLGEQLEIPADEIINNPDLLEQKGVDSLELLEMVMELEDELGLK